MPYAADTMAENGRHDTRQVGDTTPTRRVPVLEASQLLGITPDAVRARLRRGTLRKETGPDGETLVVLDADTTRQNADQSNLVEALQDQIATLKDEVDAWREEARRKDHLLAAALERIPAIEEGSSETRESPETPSEDPYLTHAPPTPETPVSEAQHKRSWWRAFFGLE